ncbi:uncharacterized protein LOC134258917 [Saccostrea cucullata]|uniref:uncharacterized protein LOC134258917 n=1 Tax=Saccostrea cuccullata TaxID=36930 RepID=UPI002ECFD020
MIQDNHNQLIFIYLEMFGIYEIADNDFNRNRMAEWIWVTQDYKHLLRYPMDIDLYTFGLLRRGTDNFHLQVEIENVEECKKSSLTNFPYEYLTKIVNNQGKGMLCHRYFENQGFKLFLFNISHVSIGYDFECFSDNLNETKYEIVTKSPIIYITIAIVVIFISFYPAFVSIAVHDEQQHRNVKFYTKADYPYTFRRLFLFLLFHNTSRTIISVFRFTFLMLLMGFSFFCVKLIVTASCENCFPTDKRNYPRVFDLTTGESEENLLRLIALSFTFLIVLHIVNYTAFDHFNTEDHVVLFDITNMCLPSENEQSGINVKILRFIPIHYFTSNDECSNSVFSQIVWRYKQLASLYFWSKICLFPMRNFTKIKHKGCKFIYVIINFFLIFPINLFVFVSCSLYEERDNDFNIFFPLIASVFAPRILEKYCLEKHVEIPPGYQAFRSSSDYDSENEIRNEHISEERESTSVKIPQSASQFPDNEISHLSNRSYQNMLQGDGITIV